jgi:hypothetical protein
VLRQPLVNGLSKDLQLIDLKLEAGYEPEAKPVGEIVEWLQEQLGARA